MALHDLHIRAVTAVRAGMTQAEAARVFAVHRAAVNRWCRAADPDALRPRRRGRKPTGGPLAPGPTAALLDAIRTRDPDDVGVPYTLWTRDAVAEYAAARFGVRRSRWVCGRWLRRHGFIGFLGRLLRSTTGPVFLGADGHPVHRSRAVREWVAAHADRPRLFFLPPYSPEVNPTEYLNNAVKGTVPRVRRARTRDELTGQVRLYLRIAQRRPDIVRRFFEARPVNYAA